MNDIPEVRILYSPLLHDALLKHAGEDILGGLPDKDETIAQVNAYEKAWNTLGPKVLNGLIETVGFGFKQSTIDVYPIPGARAFSEPLVIGTHHDPDMTVDVITHELIHRLMVDNTKVEFQTCPFWGDIFGNDLPRVARIHIVVHAIHKAIYLDYLREPTRLERDLQNCIKYNAVDYLTAWDYVDEHGYKNIIKKVRDAYNDLALSQKK